MAETTGSVGPNDHFEAEIQVRSICNPQSSGRMSNSYVKADENDSSIGEDLFVIASRRPFPAGSMANT